MDSWVFRIISITRILSAYFLHGSVRFQNRYHRLRNRRRFSDHCQPIQAHPWPWRKGGRNLFHLLGNLSNTFSQLGQASRTRSMAQPVYGRCLHFAPTHPEDLAQRRPHACVFLLAWNPVREVRVGSLLSDSFESDRTFLTIPQVDALGAHWETILWSASAVPSFACSRVFRSANPWPPGRVNASTVIRKPFPSAWQTPVVPSCPVCLLPVHLQDPPSAFNPEREPVFKPSGGALVLGGYFLLGDWVDLVPLPSGHPCHYHRSVPRQSKANQNGFEGNEVGWHCLPRYPWRRTIDLSSNGHLRRCNHLHSSFSAKGRRTRDGRTWLYRDR